MALTQEEKMDRAGTEKLSGAAPKVAGVKNLQRALRGIGMEVPMSGAVDDATVAALNAIFGGWDDAPPALRGGQLTAKQVASNLPAISKYLKLALSGAQNFGDATKDG